MAGIPNITTQGISFEVEVDGTYFRTEIDGQVYRMSSWSLLEEKVKEVMKKMVKGIDVPFMRVTGSRIRRGKAVGIHGGTGNVLIHWEDGEKEQKSGWREGMDIRPLDDTTMAELEEMVEQRNEANRRIKEIMDTHQINLKKAVHEAVKEVVDKESVPA